MNLPSVFDPFTRGADDRRYKLEYTVYQRHLGMYPCCDKSPYVCLGSVANVTTEAFNIHTFFS